MATTPRPLQTIRSRPVARPLVWRKKRYMGQQLAKLQPMVCSRLAALLHQGVVLLTTMDRIGRMRRAGRAGHRAELAGTMWGAGTSWLVAIGSSSSTNHCGWDQYNNG